MGHIQKGKEVSRKFRFKPAFGLALTRDNVHLTPGVAVDPTGWSTVLTLLPTCRKIHIVQFRLDWINLETAFGVYDGVDWAKMDELISELEFSPANGGHRKVSIMFNTKLFHRLWNNVPNYMLPYHVTNNPDGDPGGVTYSGGQADYDAQPGFSEGRVIRFDNANVVARFTALANEFGRRYADNPRVHIVGFPESSYGQAPGGLTAGEVDDLYLAHFAGVKSCLQALRTALPRTLLRAVFNYERSTMSTWIPDVTSGGSPISGLALGGPNAAQDEPGLGINLPYKGEFEHLKDLEGTVVKIMEIQRPEMDYSSLDNRKKPASTWGTLTFANNGGFLQIVGTGAHGMTAGDTVDAFDATAGIQNTAAGNFPAGYLNIKSIDSNFAVTVTNRAAWTGPPLAAGALTFADVASRSLTSPAAGIKFAPAGGYPFGSGFTYDPGITGDSTGYSPSKKQLVDFCVQELGCHYIMFTYDTATNIRSGLENTDDFIRYLNSMVGKNTISGGLVQTRPTNLG